MRGRSTRYRERSGSPLEAGQRSPTRRVGVEAEVVGEKPGDDRRRHVDRHVDGHQLPRLGSQHPGRRPSGRAAVVRSKCAHAGPRRPPGRGASAWARRASLSKRAVRREDDGGAQGRGRRLVEEQAGRPGWTVSAPPPSAKTMAGRPQAMASRGTMPKSSTPGSRTARQPR